MKTLKTPVLIFILFMPLFLFSQVGIGTTTPNASSVLDVTATDKGVLIPRVSLANISTTMLDGTNTAATGLLIYNTNAAVVGGNGMGYYYFNGTIWEQLKTTSSISDNDFYREGTTTAPNSINDDIYTQGNLAIGKTTADYTLDIEENSGSRSLNLKISNSDNLADYGIYIENSSDGSNNHFGQYTSMEVNNPGNSYGLYNRITNGQANGRYGVFNSINDINGGGPSYGVFNNVFGTGNGDKIGSFQQLIHHGNDEHFGSLNSLSGNGNGNQFGTFNSLSATGSGDKYGSYNTISTSAGGTHYGVYSEVLKAGSFAGYFLGNVSIGTTVANNYIMPPSRGTVNQVMQTDATGNLSWVDVNSILTASNGLTDNSGNIELGGTLTQATTITQGTNNLTFNLNNSGDFNIEGNSEPNLFYADGGNDRIGVLTNTPEFDIHLVQPNTFVAGSSGIGFSSGANNWKIYHSGLHFSFVENGVRRAYVNGGTGAYVVTSDRRLKKSITEVESILDKVNHLKTYRYLYKDQDDLAEKIIGFMAQDVQPMFPELVGQTEDGYFGLNYAGFGVVAIKAIQEQQDIIDAQQKQIDDLQKDKEETNKLLNDMLKRIESLESKNE